MAFTTLSQLVTDITALTVTGISANATFAYRPRQINAAQFPLRYIRIPKRERQNSTLGYAQGLKAATIEIVVFVAPLNLNLQSTNDALTVTLIDALGDTLEAAASTLGMDSYEITTDEDTIGDGETPVQAIIATVEVSG